MPIYEYLCKKCGEFETMQRITDAPLTRCPQCGTKVTKLISSTSFQLKGSGWYATDYARKSSSAKEKGSESKSESTSESGSDSKASSAEGSKAPSGEKGSKSSETKAAAVSQAAVA